MPRISEENRADGQAMKHITVKGFIKMSPGQDRTIIISSDGTGARGGIGSATNVWRIHEATIGLEHLEQFSIHDDGVGTHSSFFKKILGAMVGYGVSQNIRELYTSLAHVYKPGARIYLFGFSRGAHTIRTLAGLITTFGILDPKQFKSDTEFQNYVTVLLDEQKRQSLGGNVSRIAKTARKKMEKTRRSREYRRYESNVRKSVPDKYRQSASLPNNQSTYRPANPLSDNEFISVDVESRLVSHTLNDYGHPIKALRYHATTLDTLEQDFTGGATTSTRVPIKFMALWDTVDAVGFPLEWVADVWNEYIAPFRFKNYSLSPSISHACQALSIDDARLSFTPRLIDDRGIDSTCDSQDFSERRIKQIWFSGVHSNVGGGYPKQGLAHISLNWIATEAEKQGMKLNGQLKPKTSHYRSKPTIPLHGFREKMNAYDFLQNSRQSLFVLYKYVPRNIKVLNQRLSHRKPVIDASVFQRISNRTAQYAPWNLPDDFDVVDSANGYAAASAELKPLIADWKDQYGHNDNGIEAEPTTLQKIAKEATRQSSLQSMIKWGWAALLYIAILGLFYEPLANLNTSLFFIASPLVLYMLYLRIEKQYQQKIQKWSLKHWSKILYDR